MFYLIDEDKNLYQWDLDRTIVVEDSSITEVHFANKSMSKALVCNVQQQDGINKVKIPNILLQSFLDICVYAYDGYNTKYEKVFVVKKRARPENYIYTETEQYTLKALVQDEIDKIDTFYYDHIITTFEEFKNLEGMEGRVLVKGGTEEEPFVFSESIEVNPYTTLLEFSGNFQIDNDVAIYITHSGIGVTETRLKGGFFMGNSNSSTIVFTEFVGVSDVLAGGCGTFLDCHYISDCEFSCMERCHFINNCRLITSDAADAIYECNHINGISTNGDHRNSGSVISYSNFISNVTAEVGEIYDCNYVDADTCPGYKGLSRDYYDHVITTFEEFKNIENLTGRVLVKGGDINNMTAFTFNESIDVSVNASLLEFDGYFSVTEDVELVISSLDEGELKGGIFISEGYCNIYFNSFRGVNNVQALYDNAAPLMRFKHCSSISNCTFACMEFCENINNCELLNTDDTNEAIYYCKYINGIHSHEDFDYTEDESVIYNCSYLLNIGESVGKFVDCKFVDPDTCPAYDGDSGGKTLYWHKIAVYIPANSNNYYIPYGGVTAWILSTDPTPWTLADLKTYTNSSLFNRGISHGYITFNDNPNETYPIKEILYMNDTLGFGFHYITAYTIPLNTNIYYNNNESEITIEDTVTEV